VTATGEAVSQPGFATAGWHPRDRADDRLLGPGRGWHVPRPVLRDEPADVPGVSYKPSTNFSNEEMSAGQPVRRALVVPDRVHRAGAGRRRTLWLRLDGVNFRFDAWLNGKKIAGAAEDPPAPSGSTNST